MGEAARAAPGVIQAPLVLQIPPPCWDGAASREALEAPADPAVREGRVYDADVTDGASPVFRGTNELSHGSAGAGGGPDGAPGVSGNANLALPEPHGP